MTAGIVLTGAPTHNSVDWASLNWRKLEGNVRRLQARIVQAIQAGRRGKVKALQRLLTRSFSAKAMAVKRVTENKGKRTAGGTEKSGQPHARKRQPSGRCKAGAIKPSPANGLAYPNRAATKRGNWVFRQ